MKISVNFLSLLIISALVFLPACYEKSSIGPDNYTKTDNLLKATIEGDIALDFTAKSMSYGRVNSFSKFSASMIVNPFEIYSIEISFPDSVNHYSFDLSQTDTFTNFKVYFGKYVKEYFFRNVKGTIDFDKRNQDTMTGVFSFFAEDSLLKKSIIVKDGTFKFIKKKV
ncbi:MAG: hypothetical protein WCR42_07955 [bacterium]